MIDLRYETIKSRLSTLSKEEIERILDNIDNVCFDELNYDSSTGKYCPLATAMSLDKLSNPTDEKIKAEIGKRFQPVNVIKGLPGEFYRDNRKQNLIDLCKKLLNK